VPPPGDGSGGYAAGLGTAPAPEEAAQNEAPAAKARGELWLRRISVLLFVILCGTCGVLLVLLPWSLQWTDNRLLWGHSEVKAFLAQPFVRGVSSGLGLLDLWIGFREAVHYHEPPRQ
jgi:hypothetical protein